MNFMLHVRGVGLERHACFNPVKSSMCYVQVGHLMDNDHS